MGGIIQVDSVLNNNTSNLITQTNSTTITIGSTGQTISLASGASSSGFGLAWNPTVQTTNFTASVNVGYMVNTTSAAITVTLPAAPSISDQIAFVDFNETAATNNIILNPNGLKIDGTTSNTNITKSGEGVTILYSGTTRGWIPVSAANEGTTALASPYSIDFLVVGGGGGGSFGGGGAGGYRTSTQSANIGTVVTVTVGDGGAFLTASQFRSVRGNSGTDSSISGSGLTTITSAGGGGGGARSDTLSTGVNGGSGGGAGAYATGTPSPTANGGAGNTPSTSPSQGNNGGTGIHVGGVSTGTGGGGGAGAAGGNGSGNIGGNGGNGTASSITGSSVTRGGGGGGSGSTPGSGGTGGGGAGGYVTGATSATVNTGGGGGGAETEPNYNTGAGGKGVVILSMATVHYSGTSSGSPTVTTSGSNTILTFNGSGTYTV
jgi:hypothetical protein